MSRCRRCLAVALAAVLLPLAAPAADPPPVALANVYEQEAELADYWVSEKLDGVRGYWDGKRLLTRGGTPVNPPDWFTADWPEAPLDGELWLGRDRFAETSAIVRTEKPVDAEWREMRFMVFDLPAHDEPFTQRLRALKKLLAQADVEWLHPVEQFRVADHDALQSKMKTVVVAGGEGLMLHRGESLYAAGRSDDLLKVKPHRDAEAKVIAHLPGNGKYEGMMGSLLVERPDGLRFRLGTGFTDEQRAQPPAVGAWVTYRYSGLTKNGIPRFARFLRVRPGYRPDR